MPRIGEPIRRATSPTCCPRPVDDAREEIDDAREFGKRRDRSVMASPARTRRRTRRNAPAGASDERLQVGSLASAEFGEQRVVWQAGTRRRMPGRIECATPRSHMIDRSSPSSRVLPLHRPDRRLRRSRRRSDTAHPAPAPRRAGCPWRTRRPATPAGAAPRRTNRAARAGFDDPGSRCPRRTA